MDWRDEAIVCGLARHGENGVILRALSREHGLYAGYVPGGASRRLRGVLEVGNGLDAHWRARVAEQLGHFSVEPGRPRAALAMHDGDRLSALASVCAVTLAALPERLAAPAVYHGLAAVLDTIADDAGAIEVWSAAMVRYELGLLAELGFGLDLSRCAATGTRDDLIYVSPRSARAVGAQAGAPYRDRLLPLPAFLLGAQTGVPSLAQVQAGMQLTGYFLCHHVFAPKGLAEPPPRRRLAMRLASRPAAP
ncbi:MAG: DNA repair protein RecO [Alphaproteobacteria bacterium]|nr:MAG: DNA repair protein RecO [Alphaproteobacteria bacterium]